MSINPYNSPSSDGGLPPHLQKAPRKGMSGGKIALLILGILGGILLLCTACCVGIWMFSTNIVESTARKQFENHPHVQREIGTIETFTFKLMESSEENSRNGGNNFVFDISGPNGSGKLIASDQIGDRFSGGELRTDNGAFDLME